MSINLRFTRNSSLRTVLVDESTDRPLYQLETPRNLARKTTRIRRFAPTDDINVEELIASACDASEFNTGGVLSEHEPQPEEDPEENEAESGNLDKDSNETARVHWNVLGPVRVVFRGQILDKKKLMVKLRNGYSFTIGDTKLRWYLGFFGISSPKLLLDDGSHTVIAQSHSGSVVASGKEPWYLEITPAGMEMLDYIVLTWIFAEQKRREIDNIFSTKSKGSDSDKV